MFADIIAALGVLIMGGNFMLSYQTRKHVGRSNGNGPLTTMTERVLVEFAEHRDEDARRFDAIEAKLP